MTHVKTTEFENAWGRLDECRQSTSLDGDPLHMRLLGVSGLGKSFLLKHYRKAHPPVKQGGRTTVPVTYIPIPSGPTMRSIYAAMLVALGVDDPKGTAETLRHRTVALYCSCNVELCLFDEINHFVDGGRIKYREAAADAIKMAVESIQRPSVFCGAKRSLALYDQNMQFRSRVTSSLTLRPFSLDRPRFDELCGFINALAGCATGTGSRRALVIGRRRRAHLLCQRRHPSQHQPALVWLGSSRLAHASPAGSRQSGEGVRGLPLGRGARTTEPLQRQVRPQAPKQGG